MNKKVKVLGLAIGSLVLCSYPALAQSQPFAYPGRGQSQEQQNKDHFECFNWASQQSGFNPSQPVSNSNQRGGGILRGAAGGALLGTVGGAIGGNTGTGAAIGAGVGATTGLIRQERNRSNKNSQSQQLQQEYFRAWSACMSSRGYTVK
ncbi:MAG: hypothetical protein N5P05_003689 [Chroococcopsis gigantea SAG 12.99]|jgi:hypothetical protein|nr:hypothetical protein [Chlorogloea purpurea SAG 13.99]MDV3002083.1 hypothetical protein [Chroococcopsis gigantea SAG 12.99]